MNYLPPLFKLRYFVCKFILSLNFFLIKELISLNLIQSALNLVLGPFLQLHPHSTSSKLHSNCLLKADSWIHYEWYFLGKLGKNPYVHIVTSHHMHYFNASCYVRRKNSLAMALLEQILENVGLTNKVIFVFIYETKHEAQDF